MEGNNDNPAPASTAPRDEDEMLLFTKEDALIVSCAIGDNPGGARPLLHVEKFPHPLRPRYATPANTAPPYATQNEPEHEIAELLQDVFTTETAFKFDHPLL
jgi:hypothetical protein